MKRIIIGMACALIASAGFAQTGITSKQTTTVTEPTTSTQTTTTTYESGTVTTYEPGKRIVVRDEHQGPLSFALGTAAHVVDAAGHVVTAPIRAGQHVRVYYTGPREHRVVERVIVED